jgi:hypothetical protein
VVEAFARAGQQLLQVGARVAIQSRQEFVEVHVGRRLRQRQDFAAVQLPGGGGSGVDLHGHVLELALGAQEQGRVAVDARVFGGHFHGHRGDPFVQVHACDFADLGARDRHRLALPGGDCLSGLELGLEREVFVSEHRHPGRELEVLVREDVAADRRRDHDHAHHREERRAVALDLVADAQPAFVALCPCHHPVPSAGPEESGPLKLGTAWV